MTKSFNVPRWSIDTTYTGDTVSVGNRDPTGTVNVPDPGGDGGIDSTKQCPPFCSADGQPHGPSTGNGGSNWNADGSRGGGSVAGTAHTSSSGDTSAGSGQPYSCSGSGLTEVCRPSLDGPRDSDTNSGKYLSSLLGNGDFGSGLITTAGGGLSEGAGLVLVVTGALECGTAVLCVAGAPSMAGGGGLMLTGVLMINSGSDKLGRAFREADGASA